jgi:hypothetical protein
MTRDFDIYSSRACSQRPAPRTKMPVTSKVAVIICHPRAVSPPSPSSPAPPPEARQLCDEQETEWQRQQVEDGTGYACAIGG